MSTKTNLLNFSYNHDAETCQLKVCFVNFYDNHDEGQQHHLIGLECPRFVKLWPTILVSLFSTNHSRKLFHRGL